MRISSALMSANSEQEKMGSIGCINASHHTWWLYILGLVDVSCTCPSAYKWGHPGDKQLTLYGFHMIKDAEDGRHGTVYISMYMMRGALYYVSRDTPVEFTGWLCNDKTELEMLLFILVMKYVTRFVLDWSQYAA